MNKQKTSKARRWKVATFLPLLVLLLMAFGRTGENVLPNPEKYATITQATQEPEKQWTEADFGKPVYDPKFQSRAFLDLPIRIDSKAQLFLRNKISSWKEVSEQIRKYLDYNLADEKLKSEFEKITINGQERMAQRFNVIEIFREVGTSSNDYQNLLNSIGKVVMEIRQKYANDIYKISYQKLTSAQKSEINKLIPAIAEFHQSPVMTPESPANQPPLTIEVRAEGIIILPDKNTTPLNELKTKVEALAKGNSKQTINVNTSIGLNDKQINEVKEVLKTVKNLNVNYTTFDPVYIMVDEPSEYQGGITALGEWISQNMKYPEKAKGLEGKVYVGFIINTKGKAVAAKIAKGLSPELDAEALRLVAQMPEWKPAKQNGVPVSVKYTLPIKFGMK